MTRLPLRPVKKNPNGDKTSLPQPSLGSGREVFVDSSMSPQLASAEPAKVLPPAPQTPIAPPAAPEITSYKQVERTPVQPSNAPPFENATPAPVVAESVPETPSAPEQTTPVAAQETAPYAPTIASLSFNKEADAQNIIELQRRREESINRLPANLKKSINRLFEHLTDDTSSEVTLNGPRAIGFKRSGQRFIDNEIDFIDAETYHAIINDFLLPLTNTHDRLGSTPHLIEAQLNIPDPDNPARPPMIARVHVLGPPTVQEAKITIAKKARNQLTLDSMVQAGNMTKDMGQLLKDLARGRATIVFSGVSGSGKTTFLEAMSREFDISDRIILIEDTEELALNSSSVVQLLSHQTRPGDDPKNSVTLEWLVRQANRMRPERIIVGEVRGPEMAEFLTAANSGADGSMTTVHANSPHEAITKMISLSLKSDNVKSELSLLRDIASTVQVIVQLSVIDNRHVVSQIEEVSNTVNKSTMGIQTSPIYRFDRNTGRFNFENRVSDQFNMFLRQRGVEIANPSSLMQPRGY